MTQETTETTETEIEAKESSDPSAVSPEYRLLANRLENNARSMVQKSRGVGAIPSNEHFSKELNLRREGYNSRLSEALSRFRNLYAPLLALLGRLHHPDLANPELGELQTAVGQTKTDKLSAFQVVIETAIEGQTILAECVAELEPVVAQLRTKYEATLNEVREDLERVGQGRGTTQAGQTGNNGDAAERQFLHLAKQNDRSRAAWVKAENARVSLAGLKQSGIVNKRTADELRTELTQLTAAEISI